MNQEFQAKRPNEKWVTDITYLQSNGIRLYLSAVKDLYNNKIIAYQISHRNNVRLVIDTVKLAIKRKKMCLESSSIFTNDFRTHQDNITHYLNNTI
ncbi:DDE-type integrase/transposase/recombinase [Parageobacillus sp. VR-IP]|nr:DDE-type integrase/transposase/recombinase [Parageobacillus sp. VR-IP]